MSDSILSCCNNSYRPVTVGGAVLSLLLGLAFSFQHFEAAQLLEKVDPSLADSGLIYYLMRFFPCAMVVMGLAVLYGDYRKLSYKAMLLTVSAVTLACVIAALAIYPSHMEQNQLQMIQRLEQASKLYNYTRAADIPQQAASNSTTPSPGPTSGQASASNNGTSQNSTTPPQLDAASATQIWDYVQSQGCCGLRNITDWASKIPKSCCSLNSTSNDTGKELTCSAPDANHQQPCVNILARQPPIIKLMLYLIALILASQVVVTAVQVFLTPKYQQASQSAI